MDLLTKILNTKDERDVLTKKIFSRCYALTMNKEEAQDIAQETFTKALEKIDQFEGNNIEPWLYTIARNLFLDMRNRRTEMLSDETLEVEVVGHDKSIEISLDLQKCLDKLDDEERELMSMVPLHSYKQIEEELKISSANVRTKICRARNKLSECMGLAI